jgi:hypothetical protein
LFANSKPFGLRNRTKGSQFACISLCRAAKFFLICQQKQQKLIVFRSAAQDSGSLRATQMYCICVTVLFSRAVNFFGISEQGVNFSCFVRKFQKGF